MNAESPRNPMALLAPGTACPPANQWQALLDSSLAESEATDLQEHLTTCTACQATLDDLAVGTSGWLRDAKRLSEGPASDPDLTATLKRLRDLDDVDDGADSTPVGRIKVDFLKPSTAPGTIGMLGRYTILEVIGQGGFGVVLKAIDPDLLRPVAIKVMAPHLANNGTARKRFTREARSAAAVSHDHVVTIHAVDQFDGLPYIVMEYVAGLSLQDRLNSQGPLDPRDVARIGMQVANGLAAAHRQGLVHRDIKPANILLDGGLERVKITDFGLARAHDEATLTQSGIIAGTPLYMSPEQARGELLDPRSDLFSLGSVLYALAAGFPPFRGSNAMGVLHRINNDRPHPLRTVNPDVPHWLEEIIMKLLEKDPAKRYATAEEVAEILLASLASPPVPKKPIRRSWLVAGALAFVATLAIGTVIIFKTPEGTLEVTVDDPSIKVTLDNQELSITGAGMQEVRLKPGSYRVVAMQKDGQTIYDKVLTLKKDGREIVSVTAKPAQGQTGQTAITAKSRDLFNVQVVGPAQSENFNSDYEKRLHTILKDYMATISRGAGTPVLRELVTLPVGATPSNLAQVLGPNAHQGKRLFELRTEIGLAVPQMQIMIGEIAKVQKSSNAGTTSFAQEEAAVDRLKGMLRSLEGAMTEFKALHAEVETRVIGTRPGSASSGSAPGSLPATPVTPPTPKVDETTPDRKSSVRSERGFQFSQTISGANPWSKVYAARMSELIAWEKLAKTNSLTSVVLSGTRSATTTGGTGEGGGSNADPKPKPVFSKEDLELGKTWNELANSIRAQLTSMTTDANALWSMEDNARKLKETPGVKLEDLAVYQKKIGEMTEKLEDLDKRIVKNLLTFKELSRKVVDVKEVEPKSPVKP